MYPFHTHFTVVTWNSS